MFNVPTGLNILTTKVDDLDDDNLKTVAVGFKKLSDVVVKEVLKRCCITN